MVGFVRPHGSTRKHYLAGRIRRAAFLRPSIKKKREKPISQKQRGFAHKSASSAPDTKYRGMP